jgi:hypothetical protein
MMTDSLFLVFTLEEDDILNCRMATYTREKAEQECLDAMRNNPKRWTRIMSVSSVLPVGTHVWVSVNAHNEVQGVHDRDPRDSVWVEDLVIS